MQYVEFLKKNETYRQLYLPHSALLAFSMLYFIYLLSFAIRQIPSLFNQKPLILLPASLMNKTCSFLRSLLLTLCLSFCMTALLFYNQVVK